MPIDLTQDLILALQSPEVIAALRQAMHDPDGEVLVDAKRAAEILGMTSAAVRKAAERGQLSCHRLGRRLRFRRDELLAATRPLDGGKNRAT